jgi:hypothetical protein
MTRKKIADPLISPLQIKLFRLREMALKVVSTKFEPDQKGGPFLTNPEREFLAVALWRTGHGVDINEAFGVKATRGEHRKLNEAAKSDNIRFVMSWIAQKITTEENEYFTRRGISVKDALAAAAENFRYEDWSLRTYWFNHPELHSSSFDRPITSLPLRTRKRSLR